MEITLTKSEGLSRSFTVTIPADELQEKLTAKIEEIRPQMQLKGFRPGKVPAAHVKRMFGKSLMGEIIEETISETNQKAMEDNDLRPADQPSVDMKSDMEKVVTGDDGLNYELSVEVMPDFEPADVAKLKLERPVAEVTDEQVQTALEELAGQNKKYEPRGKTAKARDGDAVVIDFVGKIDGEAFEGGTAEEQAVVLGENRFIPGFEEQLVGVKTGEETELNVTFPEDYPSEALAGKEAVFEVKVKEVRAPETPDVDEDFAKGFGLEGLDQLKDMMRSQIQGQHDGMSRSKVKRALLDELDKAHTFDLPPNMVEAEFKQIWEQLQREKEADRLSDEDKAKSDEELEAEYRKIADRRVRLGLVLAEIGRVSEIQINEEEVAQALNAEARKYPGQEREVIQFFQSNPQAMAQIRAPIYEEKVVDYILELAEVTDKTVTREELEEEDDDLE